MSPKFLLAKDFNITRVPIDLLLELVQAELTVDDILREYPHLKRETVSTVLRVAKDVHNDGELLEVKVSKESPVLAYAFL